MRNDIIYATRWRVVFHEALVSRAFWRAGLLEAGDIREVQFDFGSKDKFIEMVDLWMSDRLEYFFLAANKITGRLRFFCF